MANSSENKTSQPKVASKKKGFLSALFTLMTGEHKNKKEYLVGNPENIDPEYCKHINEFMDTLNHLVESNMSDPHKHRPINVPILRYIHQQLIHKARIPNEIERNLALKTTADRILSVSLSKLVGLEKGTLAKKEFSQAVDEFKQTMISAEPKSSPKVR